MQQLFEKISYPFDSGFRIKNFNSYENQEKWHYHHEYELTYVSHQSGKRYIGDSIEDFKEDDLVLIGKNLAHYWIFDSLPGKFENDTSQIIVIQFNDSFFGSSFLKKPEMISIFQLIGRSSSGIVFHGEVKEKIGTGMRNMASKDNFEILLELLKILKILSNSNEYKLLSSSVFSQNEIQSDCSKINFVYDYIKNNFKEKIILEDIAKLVNMTVSAFCRYFKRKTNKTFYSCVIDFRIAHACKLLVESTNQISEVCFECGYENIAIFNRQFKSLTGLTPSNYRQRFSKFR